MSLERPHSLSWETEEPRAAGSEVRFPRLGIRALFLVWGPPEGSHRSRFLGELLGADVKHIYASTRRTRRSAVMRYILQAGMTLAFLVRHPYRLIFVQSPPIFAVLPVYFYGLVAGARFVVDAHTDALQAPFWSWTLPVHRFLSKRGITTIVTNDHLLRVVASWGARAFILADPPFAIPGRRKVHLSEGTFHVAVVSTGSYDEPIDQVLEAARALADVEFYVTGNYRSRAQQQGATTAPPNVHFTGYIPDEEFYGLLEAVQAVISLTTEDHTMQSGASEALWLGKPIITSSWPILQTYFDKGTVHVDNTAQEIYQAVVSIKGDLPAFAAGIRALQEERRQEWQQRAEDLIDLIHQSLPAKPHGERSLTGRGGRVR